jgi:hypothetical protein
LQALWQDSGSMVWQTDGISIMHYFRSSCVMAGCHDSELSELVEVSD